MTGTKACRSGWQSRQFDATTFLISTCFAQLPLREALLSVAFYLTQCGWIGAKPRSSDASIRPYQFRR